MARRLDARAPDFDRAFAAILGEDRAPEADIAVAVAEIVAAVRERGDAAVIDYSERFDRIALTPPTLRLSAGEIAEAAERCDRDEIAALRFAHERIESYHRHQRPQDLDFTDTAGVRLGERWTTIDQVGVYVPGGTAAYPSSVLMNAVPAKVAGARRIAMTVPAPDGVLHPLVLAAATIAGVDEIYRVGGAQAIAALAYGTETIAPVDKIAGPGSAYVAEAKRQVFGVVGIDMIAGPSEILVIADADNEPAHIAADLLSQAEHDTAAQSILITDTTEFADAVAGAVEEQLEQLRRGNIAGASWRNHGLIILVESLADAPALVDRVAPEHLELACDAAQAQALLARVRHAGAIFIGRDTPEVIGDYVAGTNHVLPTGRTARFASGLSVYDFLKRTSLVSCSPSSLDAIGPAARTLARAEGLEGHARSIGLRMDRARRR